MVDPRRYRLIREGEEGPGPVVYWMSRDQRAHDNWALLSAREFALKRKRPLAVVFSLAPDFMGATLRHYGFMFRGLQEVEEELLKKNISFTLLPGSPDREVPRFLRKEKAALLVTDFDPLRIKRDWKRRVGEQTRLPVIETDAHNIIPCWFVSGKQEYGAYTLRPKVHRLLPEFLTPFPALKKHPYAGNQRRTVTDWEKAEKTLSADRSVREVDWVTPGEKAARRILRDFLRNKLAAYKGERNDPNRDAQSNLSPYLHFGQLSAQRTALEAEQWDEEIGSQEAFLEELIVRRELSDNFCYYNEHYDTFRGFPEWARKTLDEHREDPRDYRYGRSEFEAAETHDELWNAAQREMVERGKMHGYMRMYWAKKILEWTAGPEEAQEIAVYLNDRYELDGRDPNGYAGIAWSVGGVHDRAWGERPVFGKIRYMSYNGCRSKFKVDEYIDRWKASPGGEK